MRPASNRSFGVSRELAEVTPEHAATSDGYVAERLKLLEERRFSGGVLPLRYAL